ncbi:putative tetraspanin/Peripherin [Helianthus debilis subsp. tardiflorus]
MTTTTGTSTFVIRWVNFFSMLVAVVVIGYGVWMSSHHDGCHKSLTLPVMGLGSTIFLISVNGFLGALKNSSIMLWMYLIMLCLVLMGILVFTVLVFETLKQYKLAELTPIEAGCCRPPSQCGYPAVNASYYDLSFHPVSSNKDCKLYKNSKLIKCYNCDSCKAGVAQYIKTEWRVVAIFNVILFVILSMVYFVGCCARRNAARMHSKV